MNIDFLNPVIKKYFFTFQEEIVCLDNYMFSSLVFWNKTISDKCDSGADFKILKLANHYV